MTGRRHTEASPCPHMWAARTHTAQASRPPGPPLMAASAPTGPSVDGGWAQGGAAMRTSVATAHRGPGSLHRSRELRLTRAECPLETEAHVPSEHRTPQKGSGGPTAVREAAPGEEVDTEAGARPCTQTCPPQLATGASGRDKQSSKGKKTRWAWRPEHCRARCLRSRAEADSMGPARGSRVETGTLPFRGHEGPASNTQGPC